MANRWWVGGTGTWDSSTTTNWSSIGSGGAGGASVPGSGDAVIFDGASGGGTVTLNFGGTITIQSISMGAFTGTWDNSVHNNNMTLSAGSSAFNNSGSGTRTVKVGSATYSLSSVLATTLINMAITTGLTWTAGSETWNITGTNQASLRTIVTSSASLTFGNLTLAANTGPFEINNGAAVTFNTITLNAGATLSLTSNQVNATALSVSGSAAAPSLIESLTLGAQVAINITSGTQNMSWCAIRDVKFQGGATFIATNSFDLGNNSGATINAPGSGGGGTKFSGAFVG